MDKARNGTTGHGSPTVMRFGYVKCPTPGVEPPPSRGSQTAGITPASGARYRAAPEAGQVVGAGPVSRVGPAAAVPPVIPVAAGMTAPAEAASGTAALRR
jgi:hypothetical protein